MFERFQVVTAAEVFASPDLRLFPNNVVSRLRRPANLTSTTPARTAVIETDYVDVDYSASYYDQRGRSFTPEKRGTTRIHFLRRRILQTFIDQCSSPPRAVRRMQSSYLGFTVLRPETPVTLGRTFVTCPNIGSRRYQYDSQLESPPRWTWPEYRSRSSLAPT